MGDSMKHLLNWKVGFCDSKEKRPNEYFPATVPGAVQLDYAKHYNLPDYRCEKNFEQFRWMEDKFWVYISELDMGSLNTNNNIFLVAKGIDYQYEIFVNGKLIYEHQGMYSRTELNLNSFVGNKVMLEIVIYPVPKSQLPDVHNDTRDEANQCCKPAVSYGWDFHPRLIPLGIWDDIYVLETQEDKILNPCVEYTLSPNRDTVYVNLKAEGCKGAIWEFSNPENKVIFTGNGENINFIIENPELWWCNGYGESKLYSWKVSYGEQEITGKTGFRTVELVKADGSWKETLTYPMTRNTPPCTLRLNGISIFSKGTNWVAPEIFYGNLNRERYLDHLTLVKEANINFVRCWGGSIINKDCFFEICDELGIMVWQEFPLACNRYEGTPEYIKLLKDEATAIVERLKSHPCLMLWCGGNELFNNWSCMTEQDEALRYFNHLTYIKTPHVPYINAAPLMGMAHGAYSFQYPDGSEIFSKLAASHYTAYTEMGVPGISAEETLKMIGDLEKLYPLNKENELALAHGRHWLKQPVEKYYGNVASLKEFMYCNQFMQYTGYQFIFEEARRQKPYCGMVANWCFNEPWPNVGNNSVISYPNNIKPAYYAIKNACRKVLASARIRKFSYIAGETLDFDLYLLNDELKKIADGTVNVYVQIGDSEKVSLLKWDYANVEINKNLAGPTIRYQLPAVEDAETVNIILDCGKYSSKYTMLYSLPDAPLNVPREMNAVTIGDF